MNDYEYYDNLTSAKLNRVFCKACSKGNFDEIKYILKNPELEKKIDFHRNNDAAFAWLLFNHEIEIIKFLIFDYNIAITDNIKAYLKDTGMVSTEIIKLFELRNLNDSLSSELSQNENKLHKVKI